MAERLSGEAQALIFNGFSVVLIPTHFFVQQWRSAQEASADRAKLSTGADNGNRRQQAPQGPAMASAAMSDGGAQVSSVSSQVGAASPSALARNFWEDKQKWGHMAFGGCLGMISALMGVGGVPMAMSYITVFTDCPHHLVQVGLTRAAAGKEGSDRPFAGLNSPFASPACVPGHGDGCLLAARSRRRGLSCLPRSHAPGARCRRRLRVGRPQCSRACPPADSTPPGVPCINPSLLASRRQVNGRLGVRRSGGLVIGRGIASPHLHGQSRRPWRQVLCQCRWECESPPSKGPSRKMRTNPRES